MPNSELSFVAILSGIGGLLMGAAALLTALLGKRKIDSDAVGEVSRAAVELLVPLQTRIRELEEGSAVRQSQLTVQAKQIELHNNQIASLSRLLAQYKAGVDILSKQVIALGMQPMFRAPEESQK